MAKSAIPQHIGFIPDGNRRWARAHNLPKEAGYTHGIAPGLELIEACRQRGIPEISIYGFTQDNTRRPSLQKTAFSEACVAFAEAAYEMGAAVLAVGDESSGQFPNALRPFCQRRGEGIRVNLLANYGWQWDLDGLREGSIRTGDIPRLDLVVRWGGGRRLSGFLPVQSVYADFYVVDDYWPDYQPAHFEQALAWFREQDRTLGG